jgi:subtilisin family serine protease
MKTGPGPGVYTIAAALLASLFAVPSGPSTVYAQVSLPPVTKPLTRPIDRRLERVDRLESRVRREAREAEETVDETAEEAVEDTGETAAADAGEAAQSAEALLDTAGSAAGSTTQAVAGAAASLLRPFVGDVDPSGWPIEEGIAVTLVDDGELATLLRSGVDILARRELARLGLTLVTIRDANASRLVSDLRRAHPDLTVDFNHVYRFASERPSDAPAVGAAIVDKGADESTALRVGMIDSAVLDDHVSLRESRVISEDFAANEGDRPFGHGTAVASLIARSAASEAEIHAASVFFQAPGFAPGATTESLIAALDWLVSQDVQVINMSLAGPANELLEAALTAVAEAHTVVVAAVGNNGPSGEPLFPAAYEGVIGVTAVDREGKVFRYANRGDHVAYAALGVDVKVADSGGSWRLESGTSMASPHIAVVVARLRQSRNVGRDMTTGSLMNVLAESAQDLGKSGFDPVFGHGLITEPPLLASRH